MSIEIMRRGDKATIGNIVQEELRVQLLRFGITEGCQVQCLTNIPFGPVVLRYGGQEIALGRELARQVTIAA